LPRNKKECSKNSARENHDVHCLHNAKPVSELLAAVADGSLAKLDPSSATPTGTVVMAAFTTVLSSVPGNPNNSAAATNSGNVATTANQFCKAREAVTQKHYPPLEPSCLSREAQPWNSRKNSKGTIISDL
jgi:hypothetical protein